MIVSVAQAKTFLGLAEICQASGALVVGQLYEVKVKGATGNFSNVGAASIDVGTQFYATGTTPTAWGGTILYIIDETRHNQITVMVPVVEADYERIRNMPFVRLVADTVSASADLSGISVVNINDVYDIDEAIQGIFHKLQKYDHIYGSGVDGKIVSWDYTSDVIAIDSAATATADGVELVVYPAGADYVASLMIGYNLYKRHGLQSESTGGYSYAQEQIIDGYPASITKMIGRYVSII